MVITTIEDKQYGAFGNAIMLRNLDDVGLNTSYWHLLNDDEFITIMSTSKTYDKQFKPEDKKLFFERIVDRAPDHRSKYMAKFSLMPETTEVNMEFNLANLLHTAMEANHRTQAKSIKYKYDSMGRITIARSKDIIHKMLTQPKYDRLKDAEAYSNTVAKLHSKITSIIESMEAEVDFKTGSILVDVSPISEPLTYLHLPTQFAAQIREE